PSGLSVWQRVLVVGLVGGSAVGLWLWLWGERERRRGARREAQLRALGLGQSHFQLWDQFGRAHSPKDFLGTWVLLYFGFTHCPDVCPEELEKMGRVMELLEEEEEEKKSSLPPVQPIFITVDPIRDDSAAMGRFLRDFHPRFLGLTGEEEQIRALASSFRVYVNAGIPDTDGDYIVDHSILLFLLGPDGSLRDCYGRSKTHTHIARSIRQHIRSFQPQKQ
ncbi:SCO2 protein, partial [Turnix velox]|nr:SCO2 protein [Turnix velox]